MKKKFLTILVFFITLLVTGCTGLSSGEFAGIKATVYKTATCGCCGIYSTYLDGTGYEVDVVISSERDLAMMRRDFGILPELESCHTTKIGDYFVEGHVPVEAINKLLQEQPDIRGIGLADMPQGSPGMPGKKLETWHIYGIRNDGSVFDFMKI